MKKLVSVVAFRLKGAGWYETDFKSGNKRNVADQPGSPDSSDSSKEDSAATQGNATQSQDQPKDQSKGQPQDQPKARSKDSSKAQSKNRDTQSTGKAESTHKPQTQSSPKATTSRDDKR